MRNILLMAFAILLVNANTNANTVSQQDAQNIPKLSLTDRLIFMCLIWLPPLVLSSFLLMTIQYQSLPILQKAISDITMAPTV